MALCAFAVPMMRQRWNNRGQRTYNLNMDIVRLKRNLDVRKQLDREELLQILAACGVPLERAALEYSLAHLSDDWLALSTMGVSLRIDQRGGHYGLQLDTWVRIVDCIYAFRNHENIAVQIRRLSISSHEKADTILVLLVARRFHNRGFRVIFEPNGKGASDLMVASNSDRVYVEVKRENPQSHLRFQRMQQLGRKTIGSLQARLKKWLVANGMRLEIRFPTLFSDQHVEQIVHQVEVLVRTARLDQEMTLSGKGNPTFLLRPRSAGFRYKSGFHILHVTVPKAGQPIQILAPENALVRCTFVPRPNLQALKKRIHKASQQLRSDLEKDGMARGIIVAELLLREAEPAVEALAKRLWPGTLGGFIGVTVISPGSIWAIPRAGISEGDMALLRYAGIDSEDEASQLQDLSVEPDLNDPGTDVMVVLTDS